MIGWFWWRKAPIGRQELGFMRSIILAKGNESLLSGREWRLSIREHSCAFCSGRVQFGSDELGRSLSWVVGLRFSLEGEELGLGAEEFAL